MCVQAKILCSEIPNTLHLPQACSRVTKHSMSTNILVVFVKDNFCWWCEACVWRKQIVPPDAAYYRCHITVRLFLTCSPESYVHHKAWVVDSWYLICALSSALLRNLRSDLVRSIHTLYTLSSSQIHSTWIACFSSALCFRKVCLSSIMSS